MTREVRSLLLAAAVLGYIALMALVPFSYGFSFLFHTCLTGGFAAGIISALLRW